jgi:hypothetical protein
MILAIALSLLMSFACLSQSPLAQPQQAGPDGSGKGGGREIVFASLKYIGQPIASLRQAIESAQV